MGTVAAEDIFGPGNRILGGGVEDVGEEIEWGEAAPLPPDTVSLMSFAPDPGQEEGGAVWMEVHPSSTAGEGGILGGWAGLFLNLEKP